MPHLSQAKLVLGSAATSVSGVNPVWGEGVGFGDGDQDEEDEEDGDRDGVLLSEYLLSVLRNFGHCGRCSNGRTRRW